VYPQGVLIFCKEEIANGKFQKTKQGSGVWDKGILHPLGYGCGRVQPGLYRRAED